MTRLTKTIREHICEHAVKAAFEHKLEDLKNREAELAEACYNAVFSEDIRNALSQVPDGWLRTCTCLRFNAGGWNVMLCSEKEMPTPDSRFCEPLGAVTGELADKVQAFSQEKTQLTDDQHDARAKMLGFLEGFSTFKQLREAWPEGEQFYQDYDSRRIAPNVPAVITKEINTMLGLADATSS